MNAASFYALDAIFPRLLRESPYVTKLAEEADYFFVSLIRDMTIWLSSAWGILSSLTESQVQVEAVNRDET